MGSEPSAIRASWLNTNYSKIFTTGGSGTLFTGTTNSDVASYFLALANSKTQLDNLRIQILSVALDVYASTTGLGWSTAAGGSASYGFKQDGFGQGTGTVEINVGSNGAAFGFANNTWHTVNDLLSAANSNWTAIASDKNLMNMANIVFNGINEKGDIK